MRAIWIALFFGSVAMGENKFIVTIDSFTPIGNSIAEISGKTTLPKGTVEDRVRVRVITDPESSPRTYVTVPNTAPSSDGTFSLLVFTKTGTCSVQSFSPLHESEPVIAKIKPTR